jgi:hypothetical protein
MNNKMNILQRIFSSILICLIFVQSSLPVLALTNTIEPNGIFVSTNGDDATGDGSINKPFKTFEKARVVAKTLHTLNNQVYVYVRGGKYFFDKPLMLTSVDSNVTYNSYNGEEVVISGSQTLTNLIWSDYSKNANIKVTQLQTGLGIDQLFVNKTQQVMARYPNYDAIKPLGGTTNQATLKTRSVNWSDPTTGYIRALHSNDWGGNDYLITGKNSSSPLGVDTRWIGDNNRGNGMDANAVVAENIIEELDTQNEWFYDNKTGKLYFYPDSDTNIQDPSLTIEAAIGAELVDMIGNNYTDPIHDVTFDGFTFTNTKRTMFSIDQSRMAYIPLLRGDWCVQAAGAVYMKNGKRLKVTNSNFTNLGGNAVFMYGYNDSNQIDNNEMTNLGASGVQVVGNNNSSADPSFWDNGYSTVKNPQIVGPITEDYPRDIIVLNNNIQNMGIFEKESAGVNLSVASRIHILHNTIHKSPRACININNGTFGGDEIAYNDVYDAQRETSDNGEFNSWGRDRFWSVSSSNNGLRNYTNDGVHYYDITEIDCYQTTTIHDNRFEHDYGAPFSWGIDLDDGSSNYDIYNNLCLGIGVKIRDGFDRNVHNNIFIDSQINIQMSMGKARDKVNGNIVLNSTPYGFAGVDETIFKSAKYAVDKSQWLSY